MDGVLVIDKPSRLTSHAVVIRVRRAIGTKRIGHIGTLDPLATGVLPLVVGRATRLASFLSTGRKTYDAIILLGVTTNTYDVTGTATEPSNALTTDGQAFELSTIQKVGRTFTGTFVQQPPLFSAKKIGGVRAYQLARRQQPVAPSPVEVTVNSLEIYSLEGNGYDVGWFANPVSTCAPLPTTSGRALGCGGCLEALRRERNGTFVLADAVSLDTIEKEGHDANRRLIPMTRLLPDLPSVVLTDRGSRRAAHGNTLTSADLVSNVDDALPWWNPQTESDTVHRIRLFDRGDVLLAIAEIGTDGFLRPKIVLV